MSSKNRIPRIRTSGRNFIRENIRAVSCSPSPARPTSSSGSRVSSFSGSRRTPSPHTPLPLSTHRQLRLSSPHSSQRQHLTPEYNTRVIRSHSSPEVNQINEKLEALAEGMKELKQENRELKQKIEDNEKESQRKFSNVEKENSKIRKKNTQLKAQVKLLERMVARTAVSPAPPSPPETNKEEGTTSRAGPGTCDACGKDFKRLDQHKNRTQNPDCKM